MAKKIKKSNLSLEERLEQALIPNWDEPYKLPEDWCWVKLDNITKISAGGTPSRGNPLYWQNGNIPWVKISDMSGKYVETTEEKITQLGLENSSAKIFKKGTILYSIFATIGDVAILNIDAATNQAIAGITCSPFCNVDYLYYVLLVLKDLLVAKAKGVAQVNINQSILKETPIPLAPLEEQQRIVVNIESLFSKLDEAKEKAQEIVDGFETRKAAILHKAFSGELTEKWRKENNVSENSWTARKINQVCITRAGYAFDSKKFTNVGYQIIRMGNLYGGALDLSRNPVFVPVADIDDAVLKRSLVNDGDILITLTGTKYKRDYGYAVCIRNPYNLLINQRILCLSPNLNEITTDYLLYYLQSDFFRDVFFSNETGGVNQGNVSSKFVENIQFDIPSYREQEEIGHILCDILEKEYQVKETAEAVIEQIDIMKKAILARAFRGELGTNDSSEESAVELLKSILSRDEQLQISTKKSSKRVSIPSEIRALVSNVREEEIIKFLLKSASQSISIQEIMALSSKKFELMDALRTLEKKQLITKNEFGEYSLTR